MAKSIFNLTLDIHNPAPQCSISIKKGDSNRRLVVRLVENGRPYRLSPGTFALFCAKKPDGNTVINECILCAEGNECDGCIVSRDDCTMMGDRIVYDVTYQTTAAVGVLSAQLLVMSSDGGQIASPCFEIVIHNANYAGDTVPSSSDYSAFAALVRDFTDQKEKLTSDITGLEKKHDDKLKVLEEGTVKYADVVDSIGEDASGKTDVPLSANAGYMLSYMLSRVIETHGEDVDSLQSAINLHTGKLDDHKEVLEQHGEDIAGVKSLTDELQETKLDASVYNGVVPKMEFDLAALNYREAMNNKTRENQYEELTRNIAALQALLDGEDLNLDQISEIVEYIKENRQEIELWAGRYVSKLDIADNLLTTLADKVLSARAGNELYSMLVGVRNSYYALNARVPEISDEDEGKFAVVVNGAWAAVKITDVSEVAM